MHSDSVQDVVSILLGRARLLNWRVKKMFELQMSIILPKVVAELALREVKDLDDFLAQGLYKLSLDLETAWLGLFAHPDSDCLLLEGRPAEFRLDEMVTLYTLKKHIVCKGCRNAAVTAVATFAGGCVATAGVVCGQAFGVLSLPSFVALLPAFLAFSYCHAIWANVAAEGAELSQARPWHLGSGWDVLHAALPQWLKGVVPNTMSGR